MGYVPRAPSQGREVEGMNTVSRVAEEREGTDCAVWRSSCPQEPRSHFVTPQKAPPPDTAQWEWSFTMNPASGDPGLKPRPPPFACPPHSDTGSLVSLTRGIVHFRASAQPSSLACGPCGPFSRPAPHLVRQPLLRVSSPTLQLWPDVHPVARTLWPRISLL